MRKKVVLLSMTLTEELYLMITVAESLTYLIVIPLSKMQTEVSMKQNHEFINFRLLIFLLFGFAGVITSIQILFETNQEMRIKIYVIWFLIKALIIIANIKYIKKYFHKLSVNGDSCFNYTEMLHNTYLTSCVVSALGLLVFCYA